MLLAVFCLRLALGMLACLLLLRPDRTPSTGPTGKDRSSDRVRPGFWRTHFLVALGLSTLATLWVRDLVPTALLTLLIIAGMLIFLGSLSWSLEKIPAGQTLVVLSSLALLGCLVWLGRIESSAVPAGKFSPYGPPRHLTFLGDLSGAALLGAALTAMLLGHFYLISPTLSIRPLLRLILTLALAVIARLLVEGTAVWLWLDRWPLSAAGTEGQLWLFVRWLVGLGATLVFCWMAWQTARIRSTQSATGILYVVVICCFVGELTGLLLQPIGLSL
jgi:hypothetical protein